MKKTLAIIAAMAMFNLANAASLNWQIAGITQPGTTTPGAGYAVYLFILEQSKDFGAKTITRSDLASLIESGSDFSQYVAATGSSNDNGGVTGATGYNGTSFTTGDSLKSFAVVFDAANVASASNYMMTTKYASVSWGSPNGIKTASFGSQSGATWTPVPEPSTTVLALAGLALLLKRRRA